MKLKHMVQMLGFLPLFATPQTNGGAAAAKPRFCEVDDEDAKKGNSTVMTFKFRNGKNVEFDLQKVPTELHQRLALHGAKQKIADSYAGVKGDFTAGIENAQEVINVLYSGEWAAEREGGGPRLGELAEAISRIRGVDVEKVRAVVEAATDEERSQWRSNATVKAEVAKIRLEKAQKDLEQQGEQAQGLQINLG